MSDARSILTVEVTNPAANPTDYQTEAIIFLADKAASTNTLQVTVTNISGASICLNKGGQFKLDFVRIPLTAEAVGEIRLSQPEQDWLASVAGTVLVLMYVGADCSWDPGSPLKFTLDGITVDFDADRAGTLTLEIDHVPPLGTGVGQWKNPALLARSPKDVLPATLQAAMETDVLYTTDGFTNSLDFYLENQGPDIDLVTIEVSLMCGTEAADLIGPNDALPVLNVTGEGSGTALDNINGPFRNGDKLAWELGEKGMPLLKGCRLNFSFADVVTSEPGQTTVTITLKNMYAYKDGSLHLPIVKEQGPIPKINSFDGWIEIVNGTPELVLQWDTQCAHHCTIDPPGGRFDPHSPPGGLRIPLQGPVQTTKCTLTAYSEQESLAIPKIVDTPVRAPVVTSLRIGDCDHIKGSVWVDWSTLNATKVHLKVWEPGLLGIGLKVHFDGGVKGFSGRTEVSVGPWLLRTLTLELTASGPEKSVTQSNTWTNSIMD